jgi:hypothetical protein
MGTVGATPIAHDNSTSFLAATAGYNASVSDFDSVAAGTTIASGGTLDGITFAYDFAGVQMLISDVFDTTSSPNFLGTEDGDVFQDGDDFDLFFDPTNALGIFFITADTMFDGDITLSAAGITALLTAANIEQTLPDGGNVYFLGIIDGMNSFSSAGVVADGGSGGPFFFYNVDDITLASKPTEPVLAPPTLLLLAVGLLCGVGVHGRKGSP